jgi:fibro-slime domain-containing protein
MRPFATMTFVAGTLVAAAGMVGSPAPVQAHRATDPFASLPSTLQLTAVIRDFKGRDQTGGHQDFERQPTAGFGVYACMLADELDAEGKPVFRGTGKKVNAYWRDGAGRNRIDPRSYIAAQAGDVNGSMQSTAGGALNSKGQFDQWYRDIPGVNMSKTIPLTLTRIANTNTYSYNNNNFFPVNNDLLGNSGGSTPNTNFHFTTEIDTEFMFERNKGQVFTFTGDDDVWVFIDGKLVVDIGGVHSEVSQAIELDRLTWLTDGDTYRLKVFHAERHRTQSNFRIDTNLRLKTVELPPVSGTFD